MAYAIKTSVAAIALLASTPAFAQTIVKHNGPDLDTQISASLANSINDAETVYGTTVAGDDNVAFTGNTAIHITGGSGFASISDSDGGGDFTWLIVNPEQFFSQYQFSVAFDTDAYFNVSYSLGGGDFTFLAPTLFQKANTNQDYQLDGMGLAFDAIKIESVTGEGVSTPAEFTFVKQNSITVAAMTGAVPEPGTWAMMLFGFGGVGFAMRRSRKSANGRLLQAA